MSNDIDNAPLVEIPVDQIWMDEDFNARKHITPASVAEIAESMRKNGLFQNPVVQEILPGDPSAPPTAKVKVVMGHRRTEGWKLNRRLFPAEPKWQTIPCKVIKPLLAHEARTMNLKENLDRQDLNMMEEARGVEWYKKQGWSMGDVAKELNKPKRWVEARYGLLALPEEIQRRAEANYLTAYQVEECIKKATRDEQVQYVRNIVDHKERGKKITAENPEDKKKRQKANALMTRGTIRSMAQMAAVQDAVQRTFKRLDHPVAMSMAFCMGVISYDDFVKHMEKLVSDENDRRADESLDPVRWVHPEVIT